MFDDKIHRFYNKTFPWTNPIRALQEVTGQVGPAADLADFDGQPAQGRAWTGENGNSQIFDRFTVKQIHSRDMRTEKTRYCYVLLMIWLMA